MIADAAIAEGPPDVWLRASKMHNRLNALDSVSITAILMCRPGRRHRGAITEVSICAGPKKERMMPHVHRAVEDLICVGALTRHAPVTQRHAGSLGCGPNFLNLLPVLPSTVDRMATGLLAHIKSKSVTTAKKIASAVSSTYSEDPSIDWKSVVDKLCRLGHIVRHSNKTEKGRTVTEYTIGPVPYVEPMVRFEFKGEVYDSIADIAAAVRLDRLLDDSISGSLPDPIDCEASP